ncbi:MAG: LytR C-terminal domain-containing protein [Minisyncoccota bacterium]
MDNHVSEIDAELPNKVTNVLKKKSHESLWGALLFAIMIVFVLISIGGIGWVTYEQWQGTKRAEEQPSISELSQQVVPKETPSTEEVPKEEVNGIESSMSDPSAIEATKKIITSVLNGGGAKGSAGVLADTLKKDGYLHVTTGNTVQNYTGVTIYYASGQDKEAEILKKSVATKYPQVTLSTADPKNQETSLASLTVIIGKE